MSICPAAAYPKPQLVNLVDAVQHPVQAHHTNPREVILEASEWTGAHAEIRLSASSPEQGVRGSFLTQTFQYTRIKEYFLNKIPDAIIFSGIFLIQGYLTPKP